MKIKLSSKTIKLLNKLPKAPLIFLVIAFMTVFIGISKTAFSDPEYVYAKIKMSQGLWWVDSARPTTWYKNSIIKGEQEYGSLNKPVAEILSVRSYPYKKQGIRNDQFDIFITLKLAVNKDANTGKYSFKRSPLSVSSPIELSFPSANISGTIIQISPEPIQDNYVEKTVKLISLDGFTRDFPYAYQNIEIGGYYHDGEEKVFEIIEKKLSPAYRETANLNAQLFEKQSKTYDNMEVLAKIKLKQDGNNVIFGEEQIIAVGSSINVSTDKLDFSQFVVADINDI